MLILTNQIDAAYAQRHADRATYAVVLFVVAALAGCGGTSSRDAAPRGVVASIGSNGALVVGTSTGQVSMGSVRPEIPAPSASSTGPGEEIEEIEETPPRVPQEGGGRKLPASSGLRAWREYLHALRPTPTRLEVSVAEGSLWWQDVEPVLMEFAWIEPREMSFKVSISDSGSSIQFPVDFSQPESSSAMYSGASGRRAFTVTTIQLPGGSTALSYKGRLAREGDRAGLMDLVRVVGDDMQRRGHPGVDLGYPPRFRADLTSMTVVEFLSSLGLRSPDARRAILPLVWR